jgi:hypothetical protein
VHPDQNKTFSAAVTLQDFVSDASQSASYFIVGEYLAGG